MRNRLSVHLTLEGDKLPTEFRLFRFGKNETENGTFIFDDAAAKSVMAARKKWGVSVMLDLEHQSLDCEPGVPDPTARDARGWGNLELRKDGLYLVNVTWTPDGARRLREKTQRYVSPAFTTDDDGRILTLVNVALTAIPATHGAQPLVAASARRKQHDGLEDFEALTLTRKAR